MPSEPTARSISPAQSDAFCITCGYPLNQLSPSTRNCPECGRPFDPDDPWSMSVVRPVPRSLRWTLGPARWLYGAVLLTVIVILIADVPLAGSMTALVILGEVYVVIALTYYARRCLRRLAVLRYLQPREILNVDRKAIFKSRLALIIAATLLLFRVPFYLVFLPGLPWLKEMAHNEYAVKPWDAPRPGRCLVGILHIASVNVDLGGVTFWTDWGAFRYHESVDGKTSWTFENSPFVVDLPW